MPRYMTEFPADGILAPIDYLLCDKEIMQCYQIDFLLAHRSLTISPISHGIEDPVKYVSRRTGQCNILRRASLCAESLVIDEQR
jgi:hypothetical protein